jgi:hypothetical protein
MQISATGCILAGSSTTGAAETSIAHCATLRQILFAGIRATRHGLFLLANHATAGVGRNGLPCGQVLSREHAA